YINKQVEEGRQLGDVLHEVGFYSTLSAQMNMAIIDGNLLSCLDQLSKLIRLKNKQLKKLRGELAYPALLIGMMVTLLICMQTFLKTEMSDNDWTSNLMLGGLVLLVIIGAFLISKIIMLLNKQDYYALNKLTRIPIIGPTLNLYVHYLIVSDLAVLLINGFSLQKICQLTDQQPKNSLQQVLGAKVKNQL
ncbi:type II secretion system F family protein, partial [Lacticaseibacillus paracasei]|uniref:type II secretion system F family protein n=1 Tax=Lacticaseibacillus paracasei TaxID=1597 RepID=UPI002E34AE64